MKKFLIFLIAIFIAIIFNFNTALATDLFPYAFTGGSEELSSKNYSSETSLQNLDISSSYSSNYALSPGTLGAAFTELIDYPINFTNPSPSPTTEIKGVVKITCQIKVYVSSSFSYDVDTTTIKYRISSSGIAEDSFGDYRTNEIALVEEGNQYAVFAVDIPNSSGDSFKVGSENYIQWRCQNTNGDEKQSDAYQIQILATNPPAITIIQPKDGDYASIRPTIEASIFDDGPGIDTTTVTITLDKIGGENVFTIKNTDSNIYNSSDGKLLYIDNNNLEDGVQYRLTISAKDLDLSVNNSTAKIITFTAKNGSIVDLVSYPSPFDPKLTQMTIRYIIAKSATVTINLYDLSRQLIKVVSDAQNKLAGIHTEDKWDGTNYAEQTLANGIYFCELIVKDDEGEHRKYQPIAIFGK